MYLLYLSFVKLYAGFIGIASLFHGKAKQWVKGRKNWEKKLKQHKKNLNKVYWFHCASLGEFDQAVPIMEKLKEKDPSIDIVVSFFSPSGYEIKKSYGLASYTCYLPIDSPSNAKKFLEILQPQKAFFIKYEVWPFYFKALEKQNIPLYLVSATFRSNQIYFKWYGKWFLKLLHIPKGIFVQNDASKEVLNKHGVSSTVTGDTRYDKVKQNADRKKANEIVQNFKKNDHVLILGSSWDPEETLIAKAFDESYKLIIAPHDVSKGNISRLNTLFPSAINYTNISIDDTLDSKILIVDCIGVLSNIYQYGDTAFIGGGFKNALHNILEPATFGLPVFFGPDREKFPESGDMIKNGSAFEIKNAEDTKALISQLFSDQKLLEELKNKNLSFIQERLGATDAVLEYITR